MIYTLKIAREDDSENEILNLIYAEKQRNSPNRKYLSGAEHIVTRYDSMIWPTRGNMLLSDCEYNPRSEGFARATCFEPLDIDLWGLVYKWSNKELQIVLAQLGLALGFLESIGIVTHDLKAENIMLKSAEKNDDGKLKSIDLKIIDLAGSCTPTSNVSRGRTEHKTKVAENPPGCPSLSVS